MDLEPLEDIGSPDTKKESDFKVIFLARHEILQLDAKIEFFPDLLHSFCGSMPLSYLKISHEKMR